MKRTLTHEQFSGVVTIAAMLLAFLMANSPLYGFYRLIHHTPVVVQVGPLIIDKPLILWINEGLMVLFFLLIGLELKREMLEGQLSTVRDVALPGLAAIGGMLVPAVIFVLFNAGDATAVQGWAVPTATDIVLALALLSLLGPRVPVSLKVFLAAMAIFDDVGAIAIIALFYSEGLSWLSLALAMAGVGALICLNAFGVIRTAAYVVVGLYLWVAVLKSGVHATLAGVVIAFAIPLKAKGDDKLSPLRRIQHGLQPWVSLGVVPVFAFLNSGIALEGLAQGHLWSPLGLGIILGLFLGKQLGIFGTAWLTIRLGLGKLPAGASWGQMYGIAILAGIGFTMSLFVSWLAFSDPAMVMLAKLSVLTGSLLSAVTGIAVLVYHGKTYKAPTPRELACCPLGITATAPEAETSPVCRFDYESSEGYKKA